jgi:hypothetical protein
VSGWCTGGDLVVERARRAANELGDKAAYCEIDTSEPGAVAKWGISDAVFVDGKVVRGGPPPSFDKIRSIITKRVRS